MSSILTNNSAMVALQTLKSINNDLSKTTQMISTGKEVGSAKDNASVWAISKVMDSDVKGFKGVSDSLSRGESTVAVARSAVETITDVLTEIKGKVVAAQSATADEQAKLQTDIDALKNQIGSIVGAAQFNGQNLISSGAAGLTVLSSLDRDNAGNVTPGTITVAAEDMSTAGYTPAATFVAAGTPGTAVISAGGDNFSANLAQAGGAFDIQFDSSVLSAGDTITISVGGQTVTQNVTAEQLASTTSDDVIAVAIKDKIDALGITGLVVDYNVANVGELAFSTTTADSPLAVTGQFQNAGAGALSALNGLNVTTGAAAALGNIETLIGTSIDAAARLGSAQTRIEMQSDFVSNLMDSLKSGIGSLVDADMEAASARLQALQVQQQLGTQALSIANQAPQSILSLFR